MVYEWGGGVGVIVHGGSWTVGVKISVFFASKDRISRGLCTLGGVEGSGCCL